MILNLNGSFPFPPIFRGWLLIKLYSGELPVSLTLVCPYHERGSVDVIDLLDVSTLQLPQLPGIIIVTIAATRMYRSLINFGSSDL
jgi:hypothetical protein